MYLFLNVRRRHRHVVFLINVSVNKIACASILDTVGLLYSLK